MTETDCSGFWLRGGGEVMCEAEGMAGLVRGELAGAGEDHGEHGIGGGRKRLAVEVWAQEGFADEVVLTAAEGAESDVGL